jgi:predicted ribosomally synthesized peptide with nif11-like leader
MSIESAKAFIERMKTDEEFAKKVIDIQDADARMALAKAEGFEFSTVEMEAIKVQLSDNELDMVVGGRGFGCTAGQGGSLGTKWDDLPN